MWVESPFNIMANQMTSSTWTVVKTSKFYYSESVKCYAKPTKNKNILNLQIFGGNYITKGYYPLVYKKNGNDVSTPLKDRIGAAMKAHMEEMGKIIEQYNTLTKPAEKAKVAHKAKEMLFGMEVKVFLVFKLIFNQETEEYRLMQEILIYDGEDESTAEIAFPKEDIKSIFTNDSLYESMLKEHGLVGKEELTEFRGELVAVDKKGGFLLADVFGRMEKPSLNGSTSIVEVLDAIHAKGGKAFNNYVEEIRMSSAI